MKITTWNVNGIRAVRSKGLLNWLPAAQPDVLCLQEVKARPDQLDGDLHEFHGYQAIWNPAQRPGYSGVATFTITQPEDIQVGMGDDRFDPEGRVIRTRHNGIYLFNTYFPSGQRGTDRVEFKLSFYASLLEACDRLHAAGEKIVICGDFNTAHNEIDLANPRQNREISGFLPIERAWVSRYVDHGFVDAFRRLYPDQVQYTWWTYVSRARERNVGWRLDYFMVSESLMPMVQDVVIHNELKGSDHCPVTLILKN